MNSPLNVIEYFFPFVQVSADPEFESGSEKLAIDCQTKVALDFDPDEKVHQVTLEITVMPESEDEKIPYAIHLIAVGLFQVDDEWDNKEKLLQVNGASILYSAAREFIITVSSRGPWPPAVLPATSFLQPEGAK
ncbi:MAG: protein-export chaperone SecB [Candidatus Electrothrix sp. Rat3]|nr:protein-export chaperone SecB [Candidatus Electrothrix rattekaaiensis]